MTPRAALTNHTTVKERQKRNAARGFFIFIATFSALLDSHSMQLPDDRPPAPPPFTMAALR